MTNQVNLSNILNQTFAEIRDNSRAAIIYLALMVPLGGLQSALNEGDRSSGFGTSWGLSPAMDLLGNGLFSLSVSAAYFVIYFLSSYWIYAAMTRRSASPSFDRFWPFVGMFILASLGIMLGFVILIIPGLILMVRWVVVMPAVIERDRDFLDAFSDSWAMTEGSSWSVFGAFFLAFVAMMVVSGTLTIAALSMDATIGNFLVGAVAEVGGLVFVALVVAIYRLAHDNDAELAAVFE